MPIGQQIEKEIIERGYWVAAHRLAIKKWATIALYLLIAFVYLIFFAQFGVYIYRVNDWPNYVSQATAPVYDWQRLASESAPRDLDIGQPQLFALGQNRYDFVVEVVNPNEQWAVRSLTYQFSSGAAVAERTSFILPSEHKYLTVIGHRADQPLTEINFSLLEIQWMKLTRLPALQWTLVEEPVFVPQQIAVSGAAQTVLPPRVTWTVRNDSTLNVREVTWQAGLFSGSALASVIEYTAYDFTFLGERPFDIALYGALPRIDKVTVHPIVNIFDPNFTYLK